MKFTIGDKVILLLTKEMARVVRLNDDETADVEINGVVFPVPLKNIDHPYLYQFIEQRKSIPKKQMSPDELWLAEEDVKKTRQGLFLVFYPNYEIEFNEEIIKGFKVFIANETNEDLYIDYKVNLNDTQLFAHHGRLTPFQNYQLHDLDFESMSSLPKFVLSCGRDDVHRFEVVFLKLTGKKLAEFIHAMRLNGAPSFQLEIEMKEKPLAGKVEIPKPKKQEQKLNDLQSLQHVYVNETIDLHTEKLPFSTKGMTNAEILNAQLKLCREFLDHAFQNHLSNVNIIHGLGKGVLRTEINRLLRNIPFVQKFDNHHDARFGFGPLMFFLRKMDNSMGRILAIDYGKKRCGLAVSDPLKIIATALDQLPPESLIYFIKKYREKEKVDAVIIGYPLHKDGNVNTVNKAIDKFIRNFEKVFPEIPIHKVDETMSSVEASKEISKMGLPKSKRAQKGLIDEVAAVLILREYLDAHPDGMH